MLKLYSINLNWGESAPNISLIDGLVSQLGDWIRYNGQTWFLKSHHEPELVQNRIKANLFGDEQFVVLQIEPIAAHGWARDWIFDWLNNSMVQKLSQASTGTFRTALLPPDTPDKR